MNPKRVVIGCVAAAVITVGIAIIAVFAVWRQISRPVPILSARGLADAGTVGFAVLRLEPTDPWIAGFFKKLDDRSIGRRQDPSEILPIEVVWTARPLDTPGREGHLLLAGISPRGKFFGMLADFSLWKAGRAGGPKVSREVYKDEGITSFPGTAMPGFIFVRGNQLAWASDIDTVHVGVDRLLEPRPDPEPATVPVLALLGAQEKGILSGAVLNGHGEAARVLTRLPGQALDLDEAALAPATALSFTFATLSADTGEGRAVVHFPEGTSPAVIEQIAGTLASRLAAAAPAGVTLEVTPVVGQATARLDVKVSGLAALQSRLISSGFGALRAIEELGEEAAPEREPEGSPASKDQSSSTFQ